MRGGSHRVDALRRRPKPLLGAPLHGQPLDGIVLHFDDRASPWHTVCEVSGPERHGLLQDLAALFGAVGMTVLAATIGSHAGRPSTRSSSPTPMGASSRRIVENASPSSRPGFLEQRSRFGRRRLRRPPRMATEATSDHRLPLRARTGPETNRRWFMGPTHRRNAPTYGRSIERDLPSGRPDVTRLIHLEPAGPDSRAGAMAIRGRPAEPSGAAASPPPRRRRWRRAPGCRPRRPRTGAGPPPTSATSSARLEHLRDHRWERTPSPRSRPAVFRPVSSPCSPARGGPGS